MAVQTLYQHQARWSGKGGTQLMVHILSLRLLQSQAANIQAVLLQHAHPCISRQACLSQKCWTGQGNLATPQVPYHDTPLLTSCSPVAVKLV